jgi:CheY-like chemotaxis protein
MNDSDTANARLLLVEDNERYLERAIKRLKGFGYAHIDTALDEDEAREKLANKQFDVIISDMRFGSREDGGFTVVDEVKKRQITSVIIILTANDTVQDCRKALKGYACWDYISKSTYEDSDKSPLEELHESIQAALVYLKYWGNPKDEKWIEDNAGYLQKHYLNQYVAVVNNLVLASADTKDALKQKLDERQLPFFLPVTKKIEAEAPLSIVELIKNGESATLEFKQTFQYDAEKQNHKNGDLRFAALKTIVAFLNTEGGTLLIGVMDNGAIFGLENDFQCAGKKKNQDEFEQALLNAIKSYIGAAFMKFIDIRFEEVVDKCVCAVAVRKSTQTAFITKGNKTELFIRTGCTSQLLNDAAQICHYISMRGV